MLVWRDHIEHTRVWSLDRPLSLQVMWKVPHRWQFENLMFVADGTSWVWQLLPTILRSAVNVVGWISNHILRWSRSPAPSPSVMSEACCIFHEVHLMHLGSWYHCLSKLFLVFLDVLWNVVGQQWMLLLSSLWQPQCGQPFSQNRQKWQCSPLLLFCCVLFPVWDGSSIVDTSGEEWPWRSYSRWW